MVAHASQPLLAGQLVDRGVPYRPWRSQDLREAAEQARAAL
jgi:hypothetical protein